jgi:hypothetical protein
VVKFKTFSNLVGKEVDMDILGAKSSKVSNEGAHWWSN